jgi:hypothetical protein
MSSKMTRYSTFAALLVIMISLFVFSWLTVEVSFPVFEYSGTLGRQLVPSEPYNGIATLVSRFLWENRALDLTGQAFVIVAAVICCLAMLKTEEES